MTSTAGPAPTLKLLFDTDPGVDDAMALLFLHRHPRAQLLGVTTVFGNAEVDVTTRNALYLAERFGITAPVARGAALPLVRPPRGAAVEVHGDDGLGNLPGRLTSTLQLDPRPAHRLIVERVVLEAKKLLTYTDLNAAEIAHFLGFDEPTHFGRFFRRYVGTTPLAWRQAQSGPPSMRLPGY